jgi:hypothetical protein
MSYFRDHCLHLFANFFKFGRNTKSHCLKTVPNSLFQMACQCLFLKVHEKQHFQTFYHNHGVHLCIQLFSFRLNTGVWCPCPIPTMLWFSGAASCLFSTTLVCLSSPDTGLSSVGFILPDLASPGCVHIVLLHLACPFFTDLQLAPCGFMGVQLVSLDFA